MHLQLKQLNRLVENSFSEIIDFREKVVVTFEKLENAKSFWSEIFLAKLEVKDGVDVEVPATVFIKIPKISENVLRCENGSPIDRLTQTLIYFSKKENAFYHHFPHASIPNFPFPKVYHTEAITGEATGGLVAENLSETVFAVNHIPGFSHGQVLRLMEALGGFHAHLLKMTDKSYVDSFKEGAHGGSTFTADRIKMMFDEALTLETANPELFGNGRIQKLAWAFDYENKNKAMEDAISAVPGILVHADLNSTNILWKKDSESDEIGAIIDYQMILIGSIAHDIVRILTLGLNREVRKSRENEYLEHYYRTFTSFFDGKPPFSMDELRRQYSLIYPLASNFTLFGITMYIKMYKDGTLGSPESKKENVKELLDRALGIVEDIEALKPIID